MRESVRAREVGKGESHSRPYHVNIRVGIMNSLECVFFPLHKHLGRE